MSEPDLTLALQVLVPLRHRGPERRHARDGYRHLALSSPRRHLRDPDLDDLVHGVLAFGRSHAPLRFRLDVAARPPRPREGHSRQHRRARVSSEGGRHDVSRDQARAGLQSARARPPALRPSVPPLPADLQPVQARREEAQVVVRHQPPARDPPPPVGLPVDPHAARQHPDAARQRLLRLSQLSRRLVRPPLPRLSPPRRD